MKRMRQLFTQPRRALRFAFDLVRFRRANSERYLPLSLRDLYPCLQDATASHGFDRHYVFHTAWAARVLARTRPERHHDFGSDLRFAACISAFVPVSYFDYRATALRLPGLSEARGDLTALPFADQSLSSVSCMHVVEHIGLGRYGDPILPDGDLAATTELARVVAPGGDLLFVVPIGRPRIEFNAHRVYDKSMVLKCFPGFELAEFALIPDRPQDGGLVSMPHDALLSRQVYGCGCFWLRKELR